MRKKKVKERKPMQILYDHLKQRRVYLREQYGKQKCTKGNLLEIELLQKKVENFLKPKKVKVPKDCKVKIGDKFVYSGDKNDIVYVVSSFPNELEISGVINAYQTGQPLTITCYYKDAIKIRPIKKKDKKKKKKSKRKSKKK